MLDRHRDEVMDTEGARRAAPPAFPDDELEPRLDNTWTDTGKAMFNNWLGLVYQLTDADRRTPLMANLDPNDPLGLRTRMNAHVKRVPRLLAGVALAALCTGAPAGSNLPDGYPEHACGERPQVPERPEKFETEEAIAEYNEKVDAYNASIERLFALRARVRCQRRGRYRADTDALRAKRSTGWNSRRARPPGSSNSRTPRPQSRIGEKCGSMRI